MYSPYHIGQHIEAVVEQVLPFGVFVRLADGTRAYIRRRKLTLDADTEPATVVAIGDTLSAIIISQAQAGECIELSRREALPDPWPEFVHRFHSGDVVRGTVTRIIPTGIFVRLAPGVSGFVPLAELAPWRVEKPDDLIWVGDDVEAVIAWLEPATKKIRLSIRDHMKQHETATAMVEYLVSKSEPPPPIRSDATTEWDTPSKVTPEEREQIGLILVVDDSDEVRAPLAMWLRQRGYEVAETQTVAEALRLVERQECGVLLVDLHLPDGDGLELARQVFQRQNPPCVCLMSSPEWLAERVSEVEKARIAHFFVKPLDVEEIDSFLMHVGYDGKLPLAWQVSPRQESDTGTLRPFTPEIIVTPRTQRLQFALEKLTKLINAEKSILFIMDPASRTISVVAQAGELPFEQGALYELDNSPVKDAIHDGVSVFEKHVSRQAGHRFRKLLNLLSFESCIGVPVEAFGEVRHTAFFFHRQASAFSPSRLRDALAGAAWLGAIIEMQSLDERVRSFGALLLGGELALGFSHEVYNKVSGLELMLRTLSVDSSEPTEQRVRLSSVNELVKDMKEITEVFQRITRAKEEREQIDVNEVIHRAELLLRPLARKERVTLALRLAPNLPPVIGSSTWLQQVILNIMLNAVQQTTLKADKQRSLQVTTACEESGKRRVKIRFADTGPGIHKQHWEKVFALGFTTRPGGTGLGLFLVRSLLERMGGAAKVEESRLPLGTTFLVELPTLDHAEAR